MIPNIIKFNIVLALSDMACSNGAKPPNVNTGRRVSASVIPTEKITHDMEFVTSHSNAKDPNAHLGKETDFQLTPYDIMDDFDAQRIGYEIIAGMIEDLFGISIPGWVWDAIDTVGLSVGLKFQPLLNADMGGFFAINSIDKGADLDIVFPVDVEISYPGQNSFKCGDKIQIDTFPNVGSGTQLKIDPSFYNMELGAFIESLRFAIGIGFSIDAGILGSWSFDDSVTIAELGDIGSLTLLDLCKDAFKDGANQADLLGCDQSNLAKSFLEVLQEALDKYKDYGFATFEEGKVTIFSPDLPSYVDISIPEFSGVFEIMQENDLSTERLSNGWKLKTAGKKTVADLEVDMVDIMSMMIPFIDTSYSLGGGIASIDLGDVCPSYQVEQQHTFEFEPHVLLTFHLPTAMDFKEIDKNGGVDQEGRLANITIEAGHSLVLEFPQDMQNQMDLINSYEIDGMVSIEVVNTYYKSVKLRLFQIAVGGWSETAYSKIYGKEKVGVDTIEQYQQKLTGFDSFTFPLSPVSLKPERPILEIEDLQVVHLSNIGNGMRSVTFQLDVQNDGNVNLNQLELHLSPGSSSNIVSSVYGLCIESPVWGSNPAYNGVTDTNLLAPDQTIEVSQTGMIQANAFLEPTKPVVLPNGCFDHTSTEFAIHGDGYARSPIGTLVEDGFNECTQQRRTEDKQVTFNLGPPAISSLEEFALYGWDGIEFLSTMSTSVGDVGTNNNLSIKSVKYGKYYRNQKAELRGSLHVGKDLIIHNFAGILIDYAQVGGDLVKFQDSEFSVIGAISSNSGCVVNFDPLAKWDPVEVGPDAKVVTVSQDSDLTPGNYQEIVIKEGSEVRLAPGEYKIKNLVIDGADVKMIALVANKNVSIDVRMWHILCNKPYRNSGRMGNEECPFHLLADGGPASRVQIHYHGSMKLEFNGAQLQGTLVAPEADIIFDKSSVLHGACFAKKVFIGANSSFISHAELEGASKSLCSNDTRL